MAVHLRTWETLARELELDLMTCPLSVSGRVERSAVLAYVHRDAVGGYGLTVRASFFEPIAIDQWVEGTTNTVDPDRARRALPEAVCDQLIYLTERDILEIDEQGIELTRAGLPLPTRGASIALSKLLRELVAIAIDR